MLKDIVNNASNMIAKNSPVILTAFAVAGVVGTVVLTVKATSKAVVDIEVETDRRDMAAPPGEEPTELTAKDKALLTWKHYVPAAITGGVTIACIIGANTVNAKRNAALASAYVLSEKALRDYTGKVVETIGEKKAEKIQDSIAQDKVLATPATDATVIETGDGSTLCFDSVSGRYFKSDMEKLRRVENDVNRMLLENNWVALNDVYFLMQLPTISIGEDLGFDLQQDGYVDFHFASCIADNGQPCLTVNFRPSPRYQYYYG